MEQKAAVKEYFDYVSSDYQKAYENEETDYLRAHIFNQRKKIVLDLIDGEKGALLDIGCGPAVMTKELLKKGFIVYGVDFSASMIERAKKSLNVEEYKDRVFFKVADIENLDFENSYFDVILCIGLIEYLQDYNLAISTISRLLKKGGIAIISVPNKASIFNIIDDFIIRIVLKIFPSAFDSQKSIRRVGIATKKFVPSRFAQDVEKFGLSKISMRFHGYRMLCLKWLFPRFWISLSSFLNKLNSFFPAKILAIDCVMKFKK